MLSVTDMEGNNNINIDDADNRRSFFVTPGLLVEVETKTTCRVGQNKEGGVGHRASIRLFWGRDTGPSISNMSSMVKWSSTLVRNLATIQPCTTLRVDVQRIANAEISLRWLQKSETKTQ